MVMKQNETWQFNETQNKIFSIWTNHRTRDPSIFETEFKFKSISENWKSKPILETDGGDKICWWQL